jgi:hypothetical protein
LLLDAKEMQGVPDIFEKVFLSESRLGFLTDRHIVRLRSAYRTTVANG